MHACQGGSGRSLRVANCFEELKVEFLKFYTDYFVNIQCAIEKCISLINEKKNQKANQLFNKTLQECRSKSQYGNFNLNELLMFPYQRILKYHLLLRELFVKSDTDQETKIALKKSWESMGEINSFLNECKRDLDETNKIDSLLMTLGSDFRLSNNASLRDFGRLLKREDKAGVKELHKNETSFNTRTLILFQKKLIYFKGKSSVGLIQLDIDEYAVEEYEPSKTSNKAGLFSSSVPLENCFILRHNGLQSQRIEFSFKSIEEKNAWKDSINSIKKTDLKSSFHSFTLHNFGRDTIWCNYCSKLLLGIFFQGCKCNLCGINVHLDCISRVEQCKFKTVPDSLRSFGDFVKEAKENIKKQRQSEMPDMWGRDKITPDKIMHQTAKEQHLAKPDKISLANDDEIVYSSLKFVPFKVVTSSKSEDHESPANSPILELTKNDFVYVTDSVDSNWYSGFKLRFKCAVDKIDLFKESGVFLKRAVKKSDPDNDHASKSWYIETDRNMAMLILNSIPDSGNRTLFMVRYKSDGGFSISIKYQGQVKHIKIQVNEFEMSKLIQMDKSEIPLESIKVFKKNSSMDDYIESIEVSQKKHFYYIDSSLFTSINDLVQYFQLKSLMETFKLDTCLGTPYREAIIKPMYTAVAVQPYDPQTQGYMELKIPGYYFVIGENEDLYQVFNQDGLCGWTYKNLLKIVS